MKVYFGGNVSCDVHNEKNYLELLISSENDIEITNNYKEADLIVFIDSCIGAYDTFRITINKLKNILLGKKKDAQVILSGCLANGVKFELTDLEKLILSRTTIVPYKDIVNYLLNELNLKDSLMKVNIPYTLEDDMLKISPVSGCINHCSFCKVAYSNFEVKSIPLEELKRLSYTLKKSNSSYYLNLFSSNLSLYGIDLYKSQMAHEMIRILSEPDNVIKLSCGSLINYYPELVEEILRNKKIGKIDTSLETGSLKLYNTMNRPISLQEWSRIIKHIRSKRPDILVKSEIIAGYPGETIDDIKDTIELIKELGIYIPRVWEYIDSPQIPASALSQHSTKYKVKSKRYYEDSLKKHNNYVLDCWYNKQI